MILTPVSAEDAGLPRLDFKLFAIRSQVLLFVTSVYAVCIAAIIALLYRSRHSHGVITDTVSEYFFIRYFPQCLGSFLAVVSAVIGTTLRRVMPYILLATPIDGVKEDVARQALLEYIPYTSLLGLPFSDTKDLAHFIFSKLSNSSLLSFYAICQRCSSYQRMTAAAIINGTSTHSSRLRNRL